MSNNETRVVYKAIADFTALSRAVRKAKKDLAELRAEEAALNSGSVSGAAASTVAQGRHTKEVGKHSAAVKDDVATVKSATVAFIENAKAAESNSTAVKSSGGSHRALSSAVTEADRVSKALTDTVIKAAQAHRRHGDALEGARHSLRASRTEVSGLGNTMKSTLGQVEKFNNGLIKIGNWRPKLMPPFIAIVPIIGGILALLNPLAAGLGAVGAAGLGFASNLGSIAGAALAAAPALAALISVVGALKMTFGGVGGVIKAFAAQQKATGKAGPATAQLTQAEQLTRATDAYTRSIQDVKFAEDDLDAARKGYIQRVDALQKAVDRAAASEARASANTQLAKENYANVMADPGATKGQKMDAKANFEDAKTAQKDLHQQNVDNAKQLAQMKKDGINADKQVIMAKRGVVDAMNAERDAQLKLTDARTGANKTLTASESATNAYKAALDKLSPSAKATVLKVLSMRDAWIKLRSSVQESFFSKVVGDVGDLTKLFPTLKTLLGGAASALGNVADRGIKMVTSQKWIDDLGTIAKNNTPLIENVGDGIWSILDALKSVAVAAGPFGVAISEGFKKGSKHLSDLLNTKKARDGLAGWLQTVLDRMRQWWRIVKNIGMTLFNYGSAASGFGQWLTDGFERITKGWRTASEDAKKKGSPFQKYLEDIKPLLKMVGDLFGTFFRWFKKTSMDPKNIKMFTDIVKILKDDLGPALGKVFDVLSKSGVGKDFVGAITSIVQMIADVLANGGIDAIKGFYSAVTSFFDTLKTTLSQIPKPVLSAIVTGLGAIAAMEFLGVTSFLGLLLKLGRGGTLSKIATGIGGLFTKAGRSGLAAKVGGAVDAVPFIGAGRSAGAHALGGKALPEFAVGSTATRKGALAAEKALARNSGVWTKLGRVVPGFGKFVAAAATAAPGLSKIAPALKGLNFGSALGKGAKGGVIGLTLGVAGDLAGQAISNGASKGKKGSGQRIGGNFLSGAAQGAGIGALAGNLIPIPGVGAGIGAAVGGAIGGVAGVLGSDQKDKDTFFADIATGWDTFWGTSVPKFWTDLGSGITGWIDGLGVGWNNFITVDLPNFVGTLAADIEFFFTDTLPTAWNTFWGTTWPKFWGDLGAGWDTFFNVTLPTAWNTYWGTTWPEFWGNLADGWNTFFNVTLPKAWNTYWGKTFPEFWTNFGAGLGTFFTKTIPDAWNGYWGTTFPKFWADFGAGIGGFFTDLSNNWNDFWGTVFGNTSSAYEDRMNQHHAEKNGKGGFLGGGVSSTGIRRANGGSVPGVGANSDTVPAMLTPGEYVVRKAIVNRVGLDNMTKFNAGLISYAQLLQTAMAEAGGPKKEKDNSMSFFSGGGLVPSIGSNFGGGSSPRGLPTASTTSNTTNSGITVEHLTVNNPTPEPAGQSLSRQLRKMAYIGAL